MRPDPMTLTARSPEDILALVPVVLGFQPEDSLVMLTFGPPGGQGTFHARVDLPRDERGVDQVVSCMVEPAVRHGVSRVLLVAYSADVELAETVTGRVRSALRRRSVDVLGRLAADGFQWWMLPRQDRVPGTPYDVSTHPFAVEAVVHGMVTHTSRADLAATLATDPEHAAAVERAVAGIAPVDTDRRPSEAAWAAALVRRALIDGERTRPHEVARLVVGMRDEAVRDAAWLTMSRESAEAAVEFWIDVVRRTPRDQLAAPATVLGFAAWLAGQGALAWCALDRCGEVDPDYRLAGLLAEGLTAAMPPSTWDAMTADDGPGRPA